MCANIPPLKRVETHVEATGENYLSNILWEYLIDFSENLINSSE
jgi:hypothetical protein